VRSPPRGAAALADVVAVHAGRGDAHEDLARAGQGQGLLGRLQHFGAAGGGVQDGEMAGRNRHGAHGLMPGSAPAAVVDADAPPTAERVIPGCRSVPVRARRPAISRASPWFPSPVRLPSRVARGNGTVLAAAVVERDTS
jgi:hypothetical protein